MQERAKISRRQILQGAADRFEVTGYGSTSMNDIVSAAQMTKGAVYFHFSSKDELAQAVIEEQHQISISAFTAVAATGAPALEQLVMVCHEMGRQLVAEPIVRAGIRLTLELASADGSQGPYVAWIRELRKLAEAAKLEGDIRDDVEPESVGRVVISAFTGVQLVSNVLTRRSDLNDRIDELFTLLLAGVVSDKRRSDVAELVGCRLETYAS
ncbi:ScbR family autoregulator-binding transcription factor [Rhodococcus qingshengii]|uniref:TetR/AcrR family transcriptional regulator n=1 Tax=Rhodococcus qingshengii JCM 15477 TaxID=1303681 RepID=A0AB38RF24_RHOSG|nr:MULTISPECIES: ScbR family autoregulator-binding transcription factor [Rhodococcus]MCY4668401.1 ScbR family autoregulator-binding transcription factor [Rhodococcus sp. (in: high G+C Gram-positive bacteria)]MBW0292176.1 TetR family transcriptional regulator [Rhodococcus sp. MH15]QXC43925.1 TetR/AcrR family transcriptional regulator [Rhodococcus qingshengii]UPU44025.1 TetR/AcrR family transcriptional regulator [Rhodococcus qingshengii JCM 15477]BCF81365.1 TetR family transcriptional regulator 